MILEFYPIFSSIKLILEYFMLLCCAIHTSLFNTIKIFFKQVNIIKQLRKCIECFMLLCCTIYTSLANTIKIYFKQANIIKQLSRCILPIDLQHCSKVGTSISKLSNALFSIDFSIFVGFYLVV